MLRVAGATAALAIGGRTARAAPRKIKVGQIGTGHAHATKLEVYRRSTDYEVVGIVEPDSALRARAERKKAFADLPWMSEEQLLTQPGLDAVLVETQVRDSLATAERAIAAGKHVHLDKPAGESLPEYRRLLDEAARHKLLVQMGYMFRYNPAVKLLRRFLDEGWLGDVYRIEAHMSKSMPPADRRELSEYRGGTMFELGCHVIDQVVAIGGKPQRVQAFGRHSAASDDTLADNMLAVCEYPKLLATVEVAALEIDGGSRRHLIVCGTSGTFQIQPLDAPDVRYVLDRDRGEYARGPRAIHFGPFERYVGDAADMASIIRGEKACDWSYEHDFDVQETVLRASGLIV